MTMNNSSGGQPGKDSVFDSYQAWLGISKEWRACTHYELLGIPPSERDMSQIEAAAVGRISHVRSYQLAYPEECTQLLNQLALALDTLVDPVKRRAYDAQVGSGVSGGPAEAEFGRRTVLKRMSGHTPRNTGPRVRAGKGGRERPAREAVLTLVPIRGASSALCDVEPCLRYMEAARRHAG
jgi:hypothetical protein